MGITEVRHSAELPPDPAESMEAEEKVISDLAWEMLFLSNDSHPFHEDQCRKRLGNIPEEFSERYLTAVRAIKFVQESPARELLEQRQSWSRALWTQGFTGVLTGINELMIFMYGPDPEAESIEEIKGVLHREGLLLKAHEMFLAVLYGAFDERLGMGEMEGGDAPA